MKLESTGLSAGRVMGYPPIAKSSTVPLREVSWECSFVHNTIGCICSAVSLQTQQASWTRPQILQRRKTVWALTLNFLTGVCESATSPRSWGGNTKSPTAGYMTSFSALNPFISLRKCQIIKLIQWQGGEQSEGMFPDRSCGHVG